MRGLAVATLCAVLLGGCVEVQTAVDSAARRSVQGVVIETLATRFPQVPKELITPFTECIIENATAVEVREFVRVSATGVEEATVTMVRDILARPQTRTCLQVRAQASGIV